jgi:predicted phage-related endonuclease
MDMIKLSAPDFGQFCDLSEKQKELRSLGIGGSDAAAVIKKSRYATPLDIYNQKMGQKSSFNGNMKSAIGAFMEEFMRKMVSQMSGIEFIKPDKELEVVHSKNYWMRCNLDFMTRDASIVGEFKVVGESDDWGEEGTDFMPDEYHTQCAHNRIVAADFFGVDYKVFYLFVLIFKKFGDHEIRQYIYRKHENLEREIIATEKHFWQTYVEKEMPPPASSVKEVNSLVKDIIDESTIADEVTLVLVEQRKTIQDQIKALQAQDDMVKTQIASVLNDKTTLVTNKGERLVTWKPSITKRFDTTKFKGDMPDIYKEYIKESQIRRMCFM